MEYLFAIEYSYISVTVEQPNHVKRLRVLLFPVPCSRERMSGSQWIAVNALFFKSHFPNYIQEVGAPGEIRTPDPLLRRQTLYPTELRAHIVCGSF